MIFVTVGTHEQQFNRLIEYVDKMKESGKLSEQVIIQTGYSTYEPRFCEWKKMFSYLEMKDLIEKARIVITHGGPASFIAPLQIGKVPIVVPRRSDFNEHVNDHQLIFCREVEKRNHNIILIEDINELEEAITSYDRAVGELSKDNKSNNKAFNEGLETIVQDLLQSK